MSSGRHRAVVAATGIATALLLMYGSLSGIVDVPRTHTNVEGMPWLHPEQVEVMVKPVEAITNGDFTKEEAPRDILGVTSCASKQFVTLEWLSGSSVAIHQQVDVVGTAADGNVRFRPCRMPGTAKLLPDIAGRSGRGDEIASSWTTLSRGSVILADVSTGSLKVTVLASTASLPRRMDERQQKYRNDENPDFAYPVTVCLAFQSDGQCHPALDAAACKEHVPTNVISRTLWAYRKNESARRRPREYASVRQAIRHGPPPPNVVVMLIDSVSWSAWDAWFPRSRQVVANLLQTKARETDPPRVVELRQMSALGAQSAVNHAALFLGPSVPEVCLRFMRKREGVPAKPKGGSAGKLPGDRRKEAARLAHLGYQHVANRVLSHNSSSQTLEALRRRHWLSAFRGDPSITVDVMRPPYMRIVYYPLPVVAWEAHCLGLTDEGDWTTPSSAFGSRLADAVHWRFFNEGVHHFNREVNGSQGCIAQQHSMDFADEVIADTLFRDAQAEEPLAVEANGSSPLSDGGSISHVQPRTSAPVIVLLAEQTPHQREWSQGAIAYFDARLARWLRRVTLEHPNTMVLLTSDHGLAFSTESHADVRANAQSILNPIALWIGPRRAWAGSNDAETNAQDDSYWRDQWHRLHEQRDNRVTHFHTWSTLHALGQAVIGGSGSYDANRQGPAPHPAVHHRPLAFTNQESPVRGPTEKILSCNDLGIFPHACRFFEEVPLPLSTPVVAHRLEALVADRLRRANELFESTLGLQDICKPFRLDSSSSSKLKRDGLGWTIRHAAARMFEEGTASIVISIDVFRRVLVAPRNNESATPPKMPSSHRNADVPPPTLGRYPSPSSERFQLATYRFPVNSSIVITNNKRSGNAHVVLDDAAWAGSQIEELTRVSAYKPDEDACGHAFYDRLRLFDAVRERAGGKKSLLPDVQHCLCVTGVGPISRHVDKSFIGG